MKIRHLKHKDFIIYFHEFQYKANDWIESEFESFVVKQGKELLLYVQWEYDNGLYTTSGYEPVKITWKDLIYSLKHCKSKYNHFFIFDGRCKRCGCKLNDDNFKLELNFDCMPFEYDFYYCNKCKQAQIDDYVKFMEGLTSI